MVVFGVLFSRFHQDFGSSHGHGDSDGTPCKPFESNCCVDYRSEVHIALTCMRDCTQIARTAVLLCCFAGFSQDFGSSDAMVTAMVRLVGFVSRIVARMITHRYV